MKELARFGIAAAFALVTAGVAGVALGQEAVTINPGAARHYSFTVDENNLQEYKNFIGSDDPLTITSFEHRNATRHIAEIQIFVLALMRGGCSCTIEIASLPREPSFSRQIDIVSSGHQVSHPIATFTDDPRIDPDKLFLSDLILAKDAFEVGLYTEEGRKDVLSITDINKVRDLRFVVSGGWDLDIDVLKRNNLNFVLGEEWGALLQMIKAGRGDVIMQPFASTPDLSVHYEDVGMTFRPVPGVKMNFGHGRHYFVSKLHPDGANLIGWLNAGIRDLRDEGLLAAFWVQSGVINPQAADFVSLN